MALQSTFAATLLGTPFVAGAMPGAQQPALADVLHNAAPLTPSLCTGTRTRLWQSQKKTETVVSVAVKRPALTWRCGKADLAAGKI